MNRIVREDDPVADLPEDLREGLASDRSVRITIEPVLTLEELFGLRIPLYKTEEEIVAEVSQMRDEWDD